MKMYMLKKENISEVLRVTAIFSLYVALFSGKYSFERFLSESSRIEWLELRFWFAAFSAFCWLLLAKREDLYKKNPCKHILIIVTLLITMYGYFMFNQILLGDDQIRIKLSIDVSMILVNVFLIVKLIRIERDVVIFVGIAEAIGVLLFTFCLLGFGHHESSGPGWAPFGGPFTFYHIESLTFCAALYLFSKSSKKHFKLLHVIIAAIGLFSVFASLSKAALIGIFAVTVYYLFWLFSVKKVGQAIGIGTLSIVVFTFFWLVKGNIAELRFTEIGVFIKSGNVLSLIEGIHVYDDLKWEELNLEQRKRIVAIVELLDLNWFLSSNKESLARLKEEINRVVIYYDTSVRMRLILNAWRQFKSNIWFGGGIGNYSVEDINMYTKLPEKYNYPHNILLEIASSTGLLGLMVFSTAVITSLIMLQRLLLVNKNILYVFGYQLFILVTAQFSGDAFDFRLFWFITLIAMSSHQNILIGSIEKNQVSSCRG